MNSFDIQERKKHENGCDEGQEEPDAGLHTPDANVGMQGQCIVPAHPESTRPDTGEPCDDGRADQR